jgi:tetratricopeptide (TPR) repeat protein
MGLSDGDMKAYTPPAPPALSRQQTPALPEATPAEQSVYERIRAAYMAKDYHGAIALADRTGNGNTDARLIKGLSLYMTGDYASASIVLEDTVPKLTGEESRYTASSYLARAYYKLDNVALSLRHAEAALALRQNDAEMRALVARLKRENRYSASQVTESTLHFTVVFDGYEHGGVSRKVLGLLDDAYREVGREFGHFPSESISVVLYTGDAYRNVTFAPDWSGGLYDGKIRVPSFSIERLDPAELKRILFHEYVHAMVRTITPQCPKWINEGLAQRLSGDQVRHVGQLIPLQSLENGWPGGGKAVYAAYLESLEAVDTLVRKHGYYAFKNLLTDLGAGRRLEDAFYSAFYISYAEFTETWGRESAR